MTCAGYLVHPFAENDVFFGQMSQPRCLYEAEKRMKVSYTPPDTRRGNTGKPRGKADPEQAIGPVLSHNPTKTRTALERTLE